MLGKGHTVALLGRFQCLDILNHTNTLAINWFSLNSIPSGKHCSIVEVPYTYPDSFLFALTNYMYPLKVKQQEMLRLVTCNYGA